MARRKEEEQLKSVTSIWKAFCWITVWGLFVNSGGAGDEPSKLDETQNIFFQPKKNIPPMPSENSAFEPFVKKHNVENEIQKKDNNQPPMDNGGKTFQPIRTAKKRKKLKVESSPSDTQKNTENQNSSPRTPQKNPFPP